MKKHIPGNLIDAVIVNATLRALEEKKTTLKEIKEKSPKVWKLLNEYKLKLRVR